MSVRLSSVGRSRVLAACLAGLLLALIPAGCVEMGQLESFREEVVQLRGQLRQESEEWEERLGRVSPGDPLEPNVRAALARSRAAEAAAGATLEHVDLVLKQATDPTSPVAQTVNELSPLIPEPARLPIALGVALAAAIGRAVQLKRGMLSIARGFQKAIEEDPAFQDRFRHHANTFRSVQTPTVKRIVDEVTSPPLLRLPV